MPTLSSKGEIIAMLLLEKRSITAIVAGYNDDKDYAYVIRDISFEIRNVYSLHS